MDTQIISLSVENLQTFDDEKAILDYFENIAWADKVTVNMLDRHVMVSGSSVTTELVIRALSLLGYRAG